MAEMLATQVGARKTAVFYQNDDYGKEGLAGLRRAAAQWGVEVAAAVPYELPDREMSLQAVTLKDSAAEAVVLFSTTTHGANVVKEMAKLGYRPALYASFALADHYTMFRLLGAGHPALMVFSGADRLHWEYEEKFARPWAAPLARHAQLLDLALIPNANHVLSDPAWMEQARNVTAQWLDQRFAAPA